jgi:hypothetical protein
MSALLVAQAWIELLYIDLVGLLGFRAIQRCVSGTRPRVPARSEPIPAVVAAMQTACALYFKPAPCLQRSAAVVRLLRRRGVLADMVIGCHLPPLQAHAWVEVAGRVVSDYQDGLEFYRVIDRW